MLKFLAWLLVSLLPFGSFGLGCWLCSTPSPAWQIPICQDDEFVRISKDDSTVVIAEVTPNGVIAIRGIDLIQGREIFRKQVYKPVENRRLYMKNQTMIDDDNSIFLKVSAPEAVEPEERYQFVRYDLQQQKIIQRYLPAQREVVFDKSCLCNSVLMTLAEYEQGTVTNSRFDRYSVYFWNARTSELITEIPCQLYPLDIGLSYDGSIAHLSLQNPKPQLELFEVRSNQSFQVIPGEVTKVIWAPDRLAFLAFEYQSATRSYHAHCYQRHDSGSFVLEWTREVPDRSHFKENSPYSANILVPVHSRHSRWRARVQGWAGDHLNFVLDRLWPDVDEYHLVNKESFKVMHRFLKHRVGMEGPFVLHHGQGYLLKGQQVMEYWEMYPVSRWYPLLGIGVGLLLAALLSWRLLQLRPNPRQTPAVISEVATS